MRARDIYFRLHVENKNLQRIYPTGTTVKDAGLSHGCSMDMNLLGG